MKVYVSLSAVSLLNGKFLPRFQFIETQGADTTFTPYEMSIESACNSEEEALKHAEIHASRQAVKDYGQNIELFIKREN